MSISTYKGRLAKAMAVMVGSAAIVVPVAQADPSPAASFGSPDPWSYSLVERGVRSPARYGPLDPWAFDILQRNTHSVPLVTEHSAGQNGTGQPSRVASSSVAGSPQPDGFDWSAAGIGAAGTLALVLVAAGGLALRRRRPVAHA